MLRKNAKVDLSKRVPLVSGCSTRELVEVAAVAEAIALPAGRERREYG
jgi:hypothetical protein